MDKPRTYAEKISHKYNKISYNETHIIDKFFSDVRNCLYLLENIPLFAVEEIEKHELNREPMIAIVRNIFKIFDAANIDLVKEIEKHVRDKSNDFEESFASKKDVVIKITGELK